jgi:galactonate dehydratase
LRPLLPCGAPAPGGLPDCGSEGTTLKISAVETIQVAEYSNLVWLELHTDEGLVGLGETFRNPGATVAYIHETCAPYLLGEDPLQIERHARALANEVGQRPPPHRKR